MKSNSIFNSTFTRPHQPLPGTREGHPSESRHSESRLADTISQGVRMQTLLVETVMAAWSIYLDQQGYPPTDNEMMQITGLPRQQIDIVLHLLAGQGRLHRSRFGWRPVRQASVHTTEAIYAFLVIFRRFYDLSPTYDEITAATYLSPATLQTHLRQLETSGHIQRSGSRLRTIRLLHQDDTIRRALQMAASQFPAFDSKIFDKKNTAPESDSYALRSSASRASQEVAAHG